MNQHRKIGDASKGKEELKAGAQEKNETKPDYVSVLESKEDTSKTTDVNAEDATDVGIDVDALQSFMNPLMGSMGKASKALTRKQKRQLMKRIKKELSGSKEEIRQVNKEAKQLKKQERTKTKSITKQLKERDKQLSDKTKTQRLQRRRAKDVSSYIGYERMFKNGLCEVEDGLYSQTISFSDISYQSSREDSQKSIINTMCGLLDYFGAETLIQFNVINTPLRPDEVGNRIFFDPCAQTCTEAQRDAQTLNDILNEKMREGVSNMYRERYLTFSCAASNPDEAMARLARMRNNAVNTLQKIGCMTHVLNGTERLDLLHSQLRPMQRFIFSYENDINVYSPLTTKDMIAPNVIDFKPDGESSYFVTEGMYGQVLLMRRFGSELCDRALSDVVDLPIPLNVSWFIQAMDKAKAINYVKQRAAWIDKEIIEEQRRAVQKGYDFTILPAELNYSKEETLDVLDHLQNKNQRLFEFTGLVYTYAPTLEELNNQVIQIISTARRNSIDIEAFDYRQREGFNSILPLGHNHVEISRMFTTAQAAMFVPFATQELEQAGGNYYGQNKSSGNLVICNRNKLASPMGFVSGKTGSGKGMFVKNEMEGTILNNPDDQIIVIDRAGEYPLIAHHHHGSEICFGVDAKTYLNPFDTTGISHMSREAQIAFKIDAMLAQAVASAAESQSTLDEADQSIISRAVELAFLRADKRDGKDPLLQDFYEILNEQPEERAQVLALRYERLVNGSMAFFNNHSNCNLDNRIIDFNIKNLPDSMLVFALINICEAVRNQMYVNFEQGKRTWLYIEEIQSLFRYPTVLNYFSRFANEGRKFGLLLTGITQSAVAMLENEAARNIVLNADFIMLLKQSPLDRREWVDLLNLSIQEEECIDDSVKPGDGLLIAGAAHVPINGQFPKGNELYELFSTNPTEAIEARQREKLTEKRQANNHS
ncbi:VirB4-like conjugal transfer ATPase, CD1110 family [Adlercreutzia agrestimuris]|uniref:VirB4-like conjugal transfer ATPase, CD1110 family n=1 Tax=Adlercreutzia agrestimuris TaxID=2941324 RepID=UPI00203FD91F|nr:conjugal transfer protein TraC [Adlercreutzia agrestimuris]